MADVRQAAEPIRPKALTEAAAHEWRRLSDAIIVAGSTGVFSSTNPGIEAAELREPASPAAPLYRLWIADNLARDGRLADAAAAYEKACERAEATKEAFLPGLDPLRAALSSKAAAAARLGDVQGALSSYRQAFAHAPDHPLPMLRAGRLAERHGLPDFADFYRAIAGREPAKVADDPAELARRALLRLLEPPAGYRSSAEELRAELQTAFGRRDAQALGRLLDHTHFAVGPVGAHTSFEDARFIEELLRDFSSSKVRLEGPLLGTGKKRYLPTSGWRGKWFRGRVLLILTRAPGGWLWTGVGLGSANELWAEHWRPAVPAKNDPLPFELRAPWPAGIRFMAGGLNEYIADQSFILSAFAVGAAGGWLGELIALAWATATTFLFASRPCGFGPRGYYYNAIFSHSGDDAFAIDFTRYRRYVPYDSIARGTMALAARGGIVIDREVKTESDDGDDVANFVDIAHADPNNPSDQARFTSRYLHFEGPDEVLVSIGMNIPVGTKLGPMDDTGTSVVNHLHFSIHDRQLPGGGYGGSVRPTPMSGYDLHDDASGTCVLSDNVPYNGGPMLEVTQFSGQNWLITPAALGPSEPPLSNPAEQRFLLLLSGVAMALIEGNSAAQWFHQTVLIKPDLDPALRFAISRYQVPLAATPANSLHFQVDQWAPYAGLASIYNQGESINSGYAVDVWRPHPFGTITDITNAQVSKLFSGIEVDCAVRDTDAHISRLSYQFALLGRIVVGKPPIIL